MVKFNNNDYLQKVYRDLDIYPHDIPKNINDKVSLTYLINPATNFYVNFSKTIIKPISSGEDIEIYNFGQKEVYLSYCSLEYHLTSGSLNGVDTVYTYILTEDGNKYFLPNSNWNITIATIPISKDFIYPIKLKRGTGIYVSYANTNGTYGFNCDITLQGNESSNVIYNQ